MTPKPIAYSPFFCLQAKKTLAKLLGLSIAEIKAMVATLKKHPDEYYHVFMLNQKGKRRQVEEPTKILKVLHGRINNLFMRTEVPTWLISGQKGKNITDNARPHVDADFVSCVDIEKFYKHVARERVYQMFLYTFNTSEDVAYLLTELIMYNDIKTGRYFNQLVRHAAK